MTPYFFYFPKFVLDLYKKLNSCENSKSVCKNFSLHIAHSIHNTVNISKLRTLPEECPLCLDFPSVDDSFVITAPCAHIFCQDCLAQVIQEMPKMSGSEANLDFPCPVCQEKVQLQGVIKIEEKKRQENSNIILDRRRSREFEECLALCCQKKVESTSSIRRDNVSLFQVGGHTFGAEGSVDLES
uniref:RING-type domain-containing protein n=1 Tax=Corethron hystrix TaxID=216773 RepID=A0A7S1FX24_9STRA|mmetsp:Transcript_35204/g.81431  ORF Transcript_35204/g.81431 Transcript_35204/m.81431 type:complete len:185 (+) Transcript_35204:32-586(+)